MVRVLPQAIAHRAGVLPQAIASPKKAPFAVQKARGARIATGNSAPARAYCLQGNREPPKERGCEAQKALDECVDVGDGVVEFCRVGAAGLCRVGAAAAFAADDGCAGADEFAGV